MTTTFMTAAVMSCQTLLTFSVDDAGPVRFGVPVPAEALGKGLRCEAGDGAKFQWSLLQAAPDPRTGVIWIEVALDGGSGRCALRAGGVAPIEERAETGIVGPAFVSEFVRSPDGVERRTWRWSSGTVEQVVRRPDSVDGAYWCEISPGLLERTVRVRLPPSVWRSAAHGAILPPDERLGAELRARLLEVVPQLPRAPGEAGRGDYVRGADPLEQVVSNLEYDTALGFLQLGLAEGDLDCLRFAHESACHTRDRDLDLRSGLPFCHGRDHRVARPEAGHCWLRGMLWTGCVFADRELIASAVEIGRSLARFSVQGPPAYRLRDVASPLFELEELLRFVDDPGITDAADRLARDLLQRWDPGDQVLRFDEGGGAVDGAAYKERLWQTASLAIPALRAHARRTASAEAERVIVATERRIVELLRSGRAGVPIQYWVKAGKTFGEVRREDSAAGVMLLEALARDDLRRVLARRGVRRSIETSVDPGSPELATEFSQIARCRWVMR